MLINFSVSNFLSFKDKTTFNFVSNNKDDSKTIEFIADMGEKTKNYRLNKANVIYGANASGKSNLLKAILFMKNMVLLSHDQNNTPIRLGYKPHLLCDSIKESEFEMMFIMNEVRYTYSFALHTQTAEIVRENLIRYDSQKPTNLYIRNGKEISSSNKFSEADERKDFVRKD
jgi:AAA15 family ATPase/GTPase